LQPLQVRDALQFWFPGQFWQAAPPVPHACAVSPVRHCPPEQQPVGQVVASQTHTLPAPHRCPAPQAGWLPHLQAPLAQVLAVNGSQALHA
jgi:hypothetical protein